MSKITMAQILKDTDALIKQSQANFKAAGYAPAAMAGGDGSGMPGSENDKPVDAGAKKPNSEVSQGLPAGTLQGGTSEPEKLEAGHATDITQPELSPSKEPMVTSDANAEAKTGAAKAANDLLSSIRSYQEKTAAAVKVAAPVKKDDAPPAATAVAKAPEVKKESKKDDVKPEIKKSEAAVSIEMSQDILAKIASVILATEDGVKYAEEVLTKTAGAEAARETFEFLQKQAAFQNGANDAEAMIVQMQKQAEAEYRKGQADAEASVAKSIQAEIKKQADIAFRKGVTAGQQKKASVLSVDGLRKLAQEVADQSVAEAMPAPGAEAAPAEAMGDMSSAPQDEEITPEDLVAALQELVQEGSIQPEAAEAIMQALAGGGEGAEAGMEGEAPAEMPAEGAGEEVAAPEAAPKEEEQEQAAKAASVKVAESLLKAIQQHKAAAAKK